MRINTSVSFDTAKYLKYLGWLYLAVMPVHALDIYQYIFVEGNSLGNLSIIELYARVIAPAIFYPLIAVLLIRGNRLGIYLFHFVALSMIAILANVHPRYDFLILVFHVFSLAIFWKTIARKKRLELEEKHHPKN